MDWYGPTTMRACNDATPMRQLPAYSLPSLTLVSRHGWDMVTHAALDMQDLVSCTTTPSARNEWPVCESIYTLVEEDLSLRKISRALARNMCAQTSGLVSWPGRLHFALMAVSVPLDPSQLHIVDGSYTFHMNRHTGGAVLEQEPGQRSESMRGRKAHGRRLAEST